MADYRDFPFDEMTVLVDVYAGLKTARQVTYEAAAKLPLLVPWALDAEDAYKRFGEEFGFNYEPPFDSERYVHDKIVGGDPMFVEAYKGLARYQPAFEALDKRLAETPTPKLKENQKLLNALVFLRDFADDMASRAPAALVAAYSADAFWEPHEPAYAWKSLYGDFAPLSMQAGMRRRLIERQGRGYRITDLGRSYLKEIER